MFLSLINRHPSALFDVHNEISQLLRSNHTSSIKVDVRETDKEFQLLADIPGVAKEDINVDFNDNVLSISVQSKTEKKEEKDEAKVWRSERSYKSMSRSFSFDTDIDVEAIAAKYENGVLSLVLPKKEVEKKVSKIQIN